MLWKLFCPRDKKNRVKDSPTATIEKLGWRQCSIVVGSDIPGVKDYQDDDIFVVLPYSCAVVQMNFDKEPNVELFRVRRTDKKDRGIQFGRSPRQLQLEMQSENESFFVNGSIHDRFFIDHSLFLARSPNLKLNLNESERITVKNWFAMRYLRNAFPTAFNSRAKFATDKLLKALKIDTDLDEILGVYLTLDPKDEELADIEDPYNIEVALGKCEGVFLLRIELRSETDVLLSEYRELVRLDNYDFISHRDDHDDPIVA